MNKILKISLLFSIVAISLFNAPTQCMEVEKDNLQLVLEYIDQLPDDFNKLTKDQRRIAIITETNDGLSKAESNFYVKEITDKLSDKYQARKINFDSSFINPEAIRFNSEQSSNFLEEDTKRLIEGLAKQEFDTEEKTIVIQAYNYCDLNLNFLKSMIIAEFASLIAQQPDNRFEIVALSIDRKNEQLAVPNSFNLFVQRKREKTVQLTKNGLIPPPCVPVNTNHYHRLASLEATAENERTQFMQENIAQKTIIELNDGTKRLIIPRFCLQ